MPNIPLGRILTNTFKLGVLAAVFGPLALGVAQCSSENDYDPWDRRALDSYLDNVGNTYYWEMKQVRKGFKFIGDRLPALEP